MKNVYTMTKKDLVERQTEYIRWLERGLCTAAIAEGDLHMAKCAIDEVLRMREVILAATNGG